MFTSRHLVYVRNVCPIVFPCPLRARISAKTPTTVATGARLIGRRTLPDFMFEAKTLTTIVATGAPLRGRRGPNILTRANTLATGAPLGGKRGRRTLPGALNLTREEFFPSRDNVL